MPQQNLSVNEKVPSMKQTIVNLTLVAISWLIFTVLGRTASMNISAGFPVFTDYLFFFISFTMFLVSWSLVFRYVHQLTLGRN